MSKSRPSSRGSGPRASSSRPTRTRAASRPGPRPGQRSGSARARATTLEGPPGRPRFTGRAAILVLVLAVLMVSYASSMRAYLQQKQHLTSLRANITESRATIGELNREKNRWDDPAYLEAQARERFGWMLPGEIGYQVIGTDGKPLGHDDTLSDPNTVTEANRPLWWQTAWGSVVAAGIPKKQTPPPMDHIRAPRDPAQRLAP